MNQPYENLPKVWAWIFNEESKEVGYLIKTDSSLEYKNLVFNINDSRVLWYKHIEPYKEPAKRPMTHIEIFKMMQENLSNGRMTYFKYKSGLISTYWDNSRSEDYYTYSTDLENWHKLEVEE